MVVGVCRLQLLLSGRSSLKSKRHSLRSLIDRLRNRFNIAVAEVGYQDVWQRSSIAIAVIGNETAHVNSMIEKAILHVERTACVAIVQRDVELIAYSDLEKFGESEEA